MAAIYIADVPDDATISACSDCGSLVVDMDLHERFHARIDNFDARIDTIDSEES